MDLHVAAPENYQLYLEHDLFSLAFSQLESSSSFFFF